MNSKSIYAIFIFLSIFLSSCLKPENRLVREGNRAYKQMEYEEAKENYIGSLEKKENYFPAQFNLGNTYYKKKDFNAADSIYSYAIDTSMNKNQLSDLFYNLGNSQLLHYISNDSLLQQMQSGQIPADNMLLDSISKESSSLLEKSIDAYKNALKSNQHNEDARYNLSYAQFLKKKLMQQQQQNQNQNQDSKENQDNKEKNQQDKNNQDQEKKKEQQDKEQQQDKQEDQKNENKEEKQQQPQPANISPEDAERMLKSIQEDDKKIQERIKKQKAKAQQVQVEKDW